MPRPGKPNDESGKVQTQAKLTGFGTQNTKQKVSMTTSAGAEDSASASLETTGQTNSELTGAKEEILTAISSLKSEFSVRLDGILSAVEETKKELADCVERIVQAELRVSTVEDGHTELQKSVHTLKERNKALEEKVVDMETRSRLNNLRLVGLPEGAEGPDPCLFLEAWIPEALDMPPLRSPIVMERAHRIGPRRENDAPPRTLIVRFLNYKQKMDVIRAAVAKKDILYKNQRVRFYNDLATEVHKQRRQFNSVRQELRSLGLRSGIIPPAKLLVTHREQTHTFNSPMEVQAFINKIKKKRDE